MLFVGLLYEFAYFTTHKSFLGWRYSSLLIDLPLLLAGWGWWRRGWEMPAIIPLLLFSSLLFITFWFIRRRRYTHFKPNQTAKLLPGETVLPAEKRLPLYATGLFGLEQKESYEFLRQAQLWQIPVGDIVIMVSRGDGSFVYEFLQLGKIFAIQPGRLIFGRKPLNTLAVTFASTWGPKYALERRDWLAKDNAPPPPFRKTIYLTFDSEPARQLVWRVLDTIAAPGGE